MEIPYQRRITRMEISGPNSAGKVVYSTWTRVYTWSVTGVLLKEGGLLAIENFTRYTVRLRSRSEALHQEGNTSREGAVVEVLLSQQYRPAPVVAGVKAVLRKILVTSQKMIL